MVTSMLMRIIIIILFQIFNFQVNYILYWQFHFWSEIQINCLFTKWKWTYIHWFLGHEVEVHSTWALQTTWPSRMHGQLFLGNRAGWATFSGRVHKSCLELPKGLRVPLSYYGALLKKLVGGALTLGQVEVLKFFRSYWYESGQK